MTHSALIGHTGFVGSNLARQKTFTHFYNSKNLQEISGHAFDLVVCAAAPGDMQFANAYPEKDLENINGIIDVLKDVKAQKIVLISTIAVYKQPIEAFFEDSADDFYEQNLAYGKNRLYLERCLQDMFEISLVLRLPALFGHGLKKNLIYDLKNPIPSFIKQPKYDLLPEGAQKFFKHVPEKGIFTFQRGQVEDYAALLKIFQDLNFTSLNFTHPESQFQFYNLAHLARDIDVAFDAGVGCVNICSEPIAAKHITRELTGRDHPLSDAVCYKYNMQSRWSEIYGAKPPYLYDQKDVLDDLKIFFDQDWS